MRFNGWICSVLVGLTCLGTTLSGRVAHAQMTGNCIAASEMQEIASHFPQFLSLSGADYCLDDSPTSRLLGGIMFMRKTQFAANMPASADELFSGRFASDWWQYFIGRIDDFNVQASCPKGVGAYVYFFGRTMYVCPTALSPNFTSMDLASIFMHEARHIDGYPHITCTHGARIGLQGACDKAIADGGSYAVTVETYSQLGRYAPDIHPAMRAYARASSVVYADEAFEYPARVERTYAFLAITGDGQFHRVDTAGPKVTTKPLGFSPLLGHIVMRGLQMVLFPDDRNQPMRYVFANGEGDINQQAGEYAVEYNGLSPLLRREWVDLHIAAQWYAKIYRDHLTFACDPRAVVLATVATDGEIPVSVLYPSGYDRAASQASLAMASGRVFEFGCEQNQPFVRDSGKTFDREFKRVHKSGDQTIGLALDGKLYRIQGWTSTPLTTDLDGRIFELAPNQTFGFYE